MPKRTVLDADLVTMNARLRGGFDAVAPHSMEALGKRLTATRAADIDQVEAPASREVSVKLIVAPGKEDEVASWVTQRDGKIASPGRGVMVATLDVAALGELDGVKSLRRAEAPRQLQMRLEQARGPETNLDQAVGETGLSGEGAVVGVIDSGVDWRHEDFRTEDGQTRLELFVHAHRPPNTEVSQFDEFDAAAINAALSGSGSVPQGDPNGHGTHCASIAAGNGQASQGRFRGVAPNATLMAVRSELFDDQIITGIRRIFSQAGNRPAVINLSLGGHWGGHDGTSAIENVVAAESGPGRIVVVAAGNEGEDHIHFNGQLFEGSDLIIPVRVGDPEFQFVDVWIPRGDDVAVSLETGTGDVVPIDEFFHMTSIGRIGAVFREDPVNLDQNLTVFIADSPVNSLVRIRLSANAVTQGDVHAWSGPRARNVFPCAAESHSIGMPATEDRAISVGSFVSRASLTPDAPATPGLSVGAISPFSSRGPTRVGGQRPDIAAPGQFITAALATNSEFAQDPRFANRIDPSGKYITIQGTSMATPFVAGVIALMLEREPDLDPAQIQQRLRATARRDPTTGRVWNRAFGYGKIDVAALLNYGQT